MLKVLDIMTKDVVTVRGAASVAEAVGLMQKHKCRSLIVERRHPQDAYGIICESDIVRKVIAYGKDPARVRVYEIMTKPCIVLNPDLGVEYVARLFSDRNLHRAPVIQGDLLGIVSDSDIINKSQFIESPRTVVLQQELQDAIKTAREVCFETSFRSEACAAAWDVVDELQSELAHQEAKRFEKSAFEEFCDEFPEAREARFFEDWCSG